MLRLNTNHYKFEVTRNLELSVQYNLSVQLSVHLSVQYNCLHMEMKDMAEKITSVKKINI